MSQNSKCNYDMEKWKVKFICNYDLKVNENSKCIYDFEAKENRRCIYNLEM